MWIILLDCSGSMADPFEAAPRGHVRRFEAKVKLEAAKKAVLFQLGRLDEETDVVLFGFTSTAEEICAGRAGEVGRFESELAGVAAHNGIDIAEALNHAVAYVAARPDAAAKPVVLLISDGKSDVEEAKAAARKCISAGIRVDMLVIDPTEEGMRMANAIVRITQGQVEPVTSDDEMLAGAGGAARIEGFKQFIRFRITREGLTGYVIAVDEAEGDEPDPKIVDVFRVSERGSG